METKANYSIVGFFILVVMVGAAGFIYWMGEYGRQGPIAELVVRIPGSANGLSIGSAVRFNGIQVGTIKKLEIDPKDPRYTIARTEVKADTPVHSTTNAKLEIQGLTGTGYIELSANGEKGPNILQQAIDEDRPAELTADRSSLSNLLTTADRIMKRIDSTVSDVQKVVENIRDPLTETVDNVNTFTTALADNSDEIGSFLSSVGKLSDTVTSLSKRIETTVDSVDGIVKAINPEDVKDIVANANQITSNVATASKNLESVIDQFSGAVKSYAEFGNTAHEVFKKVDVIVSAIDPQKVGTSMDDFTTAMADMKVAVESIKEVSNNINQHSEQIDTTITNVSEMSKKLNEASTRVNKVLVRVDQLLGSEDAESLSDQARDTLAAVKQAAETLQKNIGPIMANLNDFSGSGLREVRGLVSETRRTMDNLNRTIESIDRDPQQFIFGPDSAKSYDGRNRY